MTDRAVPARPKWDTAVLVCKACGKRAKAPKDAKPKALVAALRRLTKGGTRRSRVVVTGCLGLCPKKATAVAVVGADGARIVAVAATAELSALGPWFAAPVAPPSPPPATAVPLPAAVIDDA